MTASGGDAAGDAYSTTEDPRMSDMQRRVLLKAALAGGALGAAVSAGLLVPTAVLAAWPKRAFSAKTLKDALLDLHGTDATSPSDQIELKVPAIAENGAVVPVTVTTTLANVEFIDIVINKNGRPLGANFVLSPRVNPSVATRVKVAESGTVTALVKADGKLYSATKDLKVTIGGCGG
jgi:sulfur-oxidizing protein SoxY